MSDFKQKLPNYLTKLRIVLIPILVIFFYWEKGDLKTISTIIFLIAALSDFLDGYFARKWQVQSKYGAMLDQISDKLIVTTALCLIITDEVWLAIPAIAIICREIFVSGLREYLGSNGNIQLPVTKIAKWKTTVQMIAIIFLLLTSGAVADITVGINVIYTLGCILLWGAVALTVYTGFLYYKAAKENNLF